MDNASLLGSLGKVVAWSSPLKHLQLVLGQVLPQCCLLYLKIYVVPSIYEHSEVYGWELVYRSCVLWSICLWHKLEDEGLFFYYH